MRTGRNPKKGDPQPPKGEAKRHSANEEPESSSDTFQGNDLSSSPDEDKVWLEGELQKIGAEKPHARLTGKNVWECRDGNRKLGVLSPSAVEERNTGAVAALFDLRASVTLELDLKEVPEIRSLLWAMSSALTYGQRAVVLSLMKGENGGVNPSTHAYRVMLKAFEDWKSKQKVPERQALTLAGSVIAQASKASAEKTMAWLKKEQAEACPPWFKSESFGVPGNQFELLMDGRDLYIQLKLQGMDQDTKRCPVIRVKAHATGSSAWTTIRKVVKGDEATCRAARCFYSETRRRWLFNVSYSFPKPVLKGGKGFMVVVPSVCTTIRMFGSDGYTPRSKSFGDHTPQYDRLMVAKSRLEARRGSVRSSRALPGGGSRGHGYKRRNRLKSQLREKEQNIVQTYCGEAASDVLRRALDHGYQGVVVVDMEGGLPEHTIPQVEKLLRQFPRAQLRDAICWKAKKEGVFCKVVSLKQFGSCPNCGRVHSKDKPAGYEDKGMWVCFCGLRLPFDTWTAWRGFSAAGVCVDEVFQKHAKVNEAAELEGKKILT